MWLCMFWSEVSEETWENTQWWGVKQLQPVWLFILWCKQFEKTFENAQWWKVKKVQPMWLCILSGRQFEDTLEIHSIGDKSNNCNQCDYSSSDANNLRRHFKMHLGEKSNKCNQCDFASIQAGDLRRHLKTHRWKSQTNGMSVLSILWEAIWKHLKTQREQLNKFNQCAHYFPSIDYKIVT